MKPTTLCLALLLLLGACASKAPVVENAAAGSPAGTWSGDYGPDSERRDSITVDLKWEDPDLRGTVHAGARSFPITRAVFKPDTGAITLEFDAQGNAGRAVHYVIDGKIAGNTMSGTWMHDEQHGDFKVTRQ